MNTKERAFNLIAKTQQHLQKEELASQKIELALVDSFISEVDAADQKLDIAVDEVIKVKNDLTQAEQKLKSVLSSLKTLATGAGRIRKMYDELGVPLDSKIDKAIKKRTATENDVEELIKKINKLISTI